MDFKDLDVWNTSHQLALEIYQLTQSVPNDERYRLPDQICRAASSIPANIAEGTGRNTLKEYAQFLYNARGSIEETKYHLLLAKDLGYLENEQFDKLTGEYESVGKMLNGLINSLKRKELNERKNV